MDGRRFASRRSSLVRWPVGRTSHIEAVGALDGAARSAEARSVNGDTDRAWLDWWANASTRLGSIEVKLDLGSTDDGGDARAWLVPDGNGVIEEFEFLCSLDPMFSLRFDDGSMVAVRVASTANRREVTLHELDGPASQAFEARLDL